MKLPANVPSKYLYVMLASERAKQLQMGAPLMTKSAHIKHTYRAMDELMNQVIPFVYDPSEVMEEEALTAEGNLPTRHDSH